MRNTMNMIEEHVTKTLDFGIRYHSLEYRTSVNSGKEKATPTNDKYNRWSKMTSMMGTTLEVGDIVIKNQKIEKATTGALRRTYHERKRILASKPMHARTAGSKTLNESLKS